MDMVTTRGLCLLQVRLVRGNIGCHLCGPLFRCNQVTVLLPIPEVCDSGGFIRAVRPVPGCNYLQSKYIQVIPFITTCNATFKILTFEMNL